jgi:hypothetical protein
MSKFCLKVVDKDENIWLDRCQLLIGAVQAPELNDKLMESRREIGG